MSNILQVYVLGFYVTILLIRQALNKNNVRRIILIIILRSQDICTILIRSVGYRKKDIYRYFSIVS